MVQGEELEGERRKALRMCTSVYCIGGRCTEMARKEEEQGNRGNRGARRA
jgi:hypothetical protein